MNILNARQCRQPITGMLLGLLLGLPLSLTWRYAAAGAAAPAPVTYLNPVIDHDFPDPSILNDGGVYYAYATNGKGGTMPCARSTDLVHWTDQPDAMPTLPDWAVPGRTWAPNVRAFQAGRRYVAYFCTHSRADNTQAVGVAVAASPAGPFIAAGDAPLVDQPDQGGAIDASCFIDRDGTSYLVWKNDGNSKGVDTWLWLQKLSPNGLQLQGTPTRLIKQTQRWEGSLVEAPTLWWHGGHYYLFYSASGYSSCNYAIGYAMAPALMGPYTKPRQKPWIATTSDVCGPGGEDIVAANDGRTWMAYHTWEKGPGSYRSMSVDPLVWQGDVPYLLGPSRWTQAAPITVPAPVSHATVARH